MVLEMLSRSIYIIHSVDNRAGDLVSGTSRLFDTLIDAPDHN